MNIYAYSGESGHLIGRGHKTKVDGNRYNGKALSENFIFFRHIFVDNYAGHCRCLQW